MDDSKPIFARPSEKALRSRSSGVAGVQELQKWGGGHRELQSENDADWGTHRTGGRGVNLFNRAMKMMIFQLLLVTCVEKV
jgi:hypothetical protein